MPYYFMRDTPLQALEQLMMSQPGQKPRGGGIYRSPFHYTPKDVACEYCQNYVRKHPCRLCECTCLDERIEAGVLELNEFVRDCFAPSILIAGLMVFKDHALLGLGLMLSAGEIPRIAGTFGLDTTTRANIMSAVYTAQAAVNTTRTIVQAVSK